jgi:hypothetical protein
MMFDLNGNEFQENSIFNGGNAGLVKNIDISIEKKTDSGNTPDYKLVAKDAGGTVNVGFYYITPNPQKTEEENAKWEKLNVSRVVHIARAVMGKDYTFPSVTSAKQAYDVLFDLISKNCINKKFNVYVTYGTTNKPSKYLGFRFFSFIESSDNESSTLLHKAGDLLERPTEDSNKVDTDDLNITSTTMSKSFTL